MSSKKSIRVIIGDVLDAVARDPTYRTASELQGRAPDDDWRAESEHRHGYIDRIMGELIARLDDVKR